MEIPVGAGLIVDLIVALILVFSFLGGLRKGAVKEFFGLLAFIVALPLTGLFTGYVSDWLQFIADSYWRAFFSFLLTMGIITIILYLLFWLPRSLLDRIWNGGFIWNVLGGIFGLTNVALRLVLMVTLFDIYPLLDWVNDLFLSSGVLNWLVAAFEPFILSLLRATIVY